MFVSLLAMDGRTIGCGALGLFDAHGLEQEMVRLAYGLIAYH